MARAQRVIYDAFPTRAGAVGAAKDVNASTPRDSACPSGAGAVVRKLKHPQGGGRLRYGVYVRKSCRLL